MPETKLNVKKGADYVSILKKPSFARLFLIGVPDRRRNPHEPMFFMGSSRSFRATHPQTYPQNHALLNLLILRFYHMMRQVVSHRPALSREEK